MEVVEPVILLLANANTDVVKIAGFCDILGAIGDKRAIEPLIQVFENAERIVVTSMLPLKEDIGEHQLFAWGGISIQEFNPSFALFGRLVLLQSSARALGQMKDSRVLEALKKRANDPDPIVRKTVQEAIHNSIIVNKG